MRAEVQRGRVAHAPSRAVFGALAEKRLDLGRASQDGLKDGFGEGAKAGTRGRVPNPIPQLQPAAIYS